MSTIDRMKNNELKNILFKKIINIKINVTQVFGSNL
jgi:hypothetical protein